MKILKSWWYWYNMFVWYGYSNVDAFIKATQVKSGKTVEIEDASKKRKE